MAKSVLDILIKLSKQGNADKQVEQGLFKLKAAFSDAAVVAGTLVAAGYAVKKGFDATVGTMVQYADQVRTTSRATQLGAEESSRLIQMTDDLGVSYEGLEKAIKSSSDTTDFSIAGLMKTSEEYLKITDAQERAKFAQKQYGKAWIEMVGVLEKGPDAIRAASDAIDDNLILTDEAVKQAREYEINIDNLNDSITGLKIEIGSQLLPVINQLVEAHKVENRAIEQEVELRKELARMSGLNWTQYQHLTSEQKKAYESQARLNLSIQSGSSDAEKMMSVNKNLANTLTEVSDAAVITAESMNAINTEYLGTLGQVQSAETSYQDNAKSLLEERARLEQERADAISQGWWEGSEKIKEFDAALIENNLKARENATEHELANRKIILGLLERKLTADGVLDDRELQWLLDKGVAWGIYSQTVVDETARAIKEANNLVSAINAIPTSKSFTMFMNMNSSNAVNVRPGSGRASGGPVSANSMYVVGEEGPELFVPNQSGTIIPNGGGAGSGGGRGAASSIVVNLSMNSVVSMADRESMKRLTPFIIDGIREAQAQGYIK
jgi:hypothetical protein